MTETDLDEPVGYLALPPGTPVVTSDGATVGAVEQVRYHEREQILDGMIVRSADGLRFVDAPEVEVMTRRKVDIGLTRLDYLMLPLLGGGPPPPEGEPDGPLSNIRRGLGI